ncbi:hypothetical protein ANN_12021 [Periplaneta americana]|uniref:Uncharacterized protein n=1 Tax=Periplaneta americana TaxID=6978 RepID=A0ABQ8T8Z1_PERAM|nr:hypothetical protein ANN_12021 [Periplaneta americana]
MSSISESHEIKTEKHMAIWKLLLALWMAFQAHTDLICYVIIFWYHMESASILSLPLPLMVLLWGTLSLPRPSVTFWAQLQKYKSNQSLIMITNQSMLKSLGLWLSKYEIDLEHDDQEFSLDEEGLHPLEKHKTTESEEVMPLISRGHESSSKMILSHLSSDLIPEPIRNNSKKKILLRMKEEDLKKNLSFSVALGYVLKSLSSMSLLLLVCELVKEYCSPVSEFFSTLLHPPSHGAVDVYAFMFFCELFNFVLTIFGYSAFGSDVIGDTEITSYLEEDRVPTQFLIIMLIQFTLIVIDRALYLRKFIIGKIIFQIFLIIIIHVWMFFLLPYSTGKFATLESSETEKELDVNSVWENIRDSIKIAAEQSIGYYETKKKKPWFDEDCCMVVERRTQAKLKFLQDPVEEKRDNYFNERREASRLRNKKREVT